jgi:D-alanyl-D-alanine carboxypeptidase/D-alanyl-D-alanine-endopeptidase (penicillin-binding protein 4)
VHAKTGTYVVGSAAGPVFKAQALAGYIDARSGRHLAFTMTVNDVGSISGVDEILPVFQDQGTIAAILWRSQ